MNAEQIKTLIDTANNLSEIASAMAAKCAHLEKENSSLLKKLSDKAEIVNRVRSILFFASNKIEPAAVGVDRPSKEELQTLIRSTFHDIVTAGTVLSKKRLESFTTNK